jgi:HD-like signal output (HDOD) protein/CheY-like chemotaxis protein
VTQHQRQILFVDDETRVLDGLRRTLHGLRDEWAMTFACGGREAIARLSERPFDVVVTDMKMPGMDGAELLQYAQQKHPDVVRIVLSGHTELQAAMRALPIAQEFLSKPCDPTALRQAVERGCTLRSLLADVRKRHGLGDAVRLPVLPQVYRDVTAALQAEASIPDVAAIVERDPAISAKLLQIVNSGFFGLRRQVTGIAEAVSFMGLSTLRDLVLSAGVFRQFEARAGLDLASFQRHAALVARVARGLCGDPVQAQVAFTAGLLHDLGLLLVQSAAAHTDHAAAGGYLLGHWGLPFPIVAAVTYHHAPGDQPGAAFGAGAAVHVADCLVHEIEGGAAALDTAWLEATGVGDRLSGWRELAGRIAAQL